MAMREYRPEDLLAEVQGRINEAYILTSYDGRVQNKYISDWHDGLVFADRLYRGEFTTLYPDETAKIKTPMVMNTIQTGCDDVARLCMESIATVRCPPQGQKDSDTIDARMRESAMMTWWDAGGGELLIPALSMDLNLCGAAFLACILEPGNPYPVPHRINPRGAFPSFVGNKLVDLMVTETLHENQAEARFGDIFRAGYSKAPRTLSKTGEVTIVDYYGPDALATAIVCKSGGQGKSYAFFVQWGLNTLGRLPVAFEKRPTADGGLRGIYNQAGGKLLAENQIMQLEIDYLDQGIHSQVVQRDTDVKEVGLGFPEKPITLLSETATISRLQPAIDPPQVWNLMQMLENSARAETSYPAARQGDLTESIVSAAGITAHQGALATLVRDTNRILGALRREWNEVAALMDPPGEKPLLYPVGNKRTYDSRKTFEADGECQNYNRVIYSIGSGLDKPAQNVAILQALGSGLVTKEMAIEQMDYSADPSAVMQKLEESETADIYKQKLLGDPNTGPDMIGKILMKQREGLRFVDAAHAVQAELEAQQQAAAQAQQQQTAPGMPEGMAEGAPPEAAQEQQTALEKGATGPETSQGIQPAFAPPPIEQVLVR